MALPNSHNRRQFLKTAGAATAAGVTTPYWNTAARADEPAAAASDKVILGSIGVGSRGSQIANGAAKYGTMVAAADVDSSRVEKYCKGVQERFGNTPEAYGDYRRLLERKDIDAVTIGTPDHWHTKIAIEAMQAGKDVYCEKPLTLTIEEGQLICKAVKDTGRVFQVGTQQRSDFRGRFLKAVTMVREGRIGDVKRVWLAIGSSPEKGPFETEPVPKTLDWDMWQGQTPAVDYLKRRCHYEFRWWYEYSGGKMTDWGAHHVDIAQWACGLDDTSPVSITPLSSKHPVEFKDGYPVLADRYNTATEFQIDCKFANGLEMRIANAIDEPVAQFGNGVLWEGTEGRLFVNRGKLTGKPVEELADNPLPDDAFVRTYKGRKPNNHMADFFDCIRTRELPISDVFSHHRMLTTCHLSNIAIRLGRSLQWNPETETIQGDPQAAAMTARTQREGYEIPKV